MIVPLQIAITAVGRVRRGTTIYNKGPSTVYVDTDQATVIAAPQSSAIVITPDSSYTWSGKPGLLYGTDPSGALSTVVTSDQTDASSLVPAATDIIALATGVAQAISAEGLTLVGSPQLLYSIQGAPGGGGTAGLVGVTVPNQALNGTGCTDPYAKGLSQANGDKLALTAISRSLSNGHNPVTKKFWNTSNGHAGQGAGVWGSAFNDMVNYRAFGTVVYACVKPFFTPGGVATGAGTGTIGTAADVTNLAAFISGLQGLGFNANNLRIIFWQEAANAANNMSAADYGELHAFYAPTVFASGIPLIISVNYAQAAAQGTHGATDYALAALARGTAYSGGSVYGGITMDYYTNHFFNTPQTLLDTNDSLGRNIQGIADANNLPFGVIEVGCNLGSGAGHFTLAQCLQYFAYLTSFMTARLQANKPNGDVIYYEGQCSTAGTGDITNPIVTTTDGRVGAFQTMWDVLTTSPGSSFTLPGGPHTTRLTPQNPSPNAGFASANYMGYEFSIGLTAGAVPTNPFAIVTLNFYDFDQSGASQIPVDIVQFYVPMGTNADPNGPVVIYGHGPARGGFVDIKIDNLDTVAATLTQFQFSGTSRLDFLHEWRWDVAGAPAIPIAPAGFVGNLPCAKASLQLGRLAAQNVPASSTKSWLMGIDPGPCFVRIGCTGLTADNCNVKLQPQPTTIFGAQNLINESVGSGSGEFLATIALPRASCLVTVTNNDPANAASVSLELIAIEGSG